MGVLPSLEARLFLSELLPEWLFLECACIFIPQCWRQLQEDSGVARCFFTAFPSLVLSLLLRSHLKEVDVLIVFLRQNKKLHLTDMRSPSCHPVFNPCCLECEKIRKQNHSFKYFPRGVTCHKCNGSEIFHSSIYGLVAVRVCAGFCQAAD